MPAECVDVMTDVLNTATGLVLALTAAGVLFMLDLLLWYRAHGRDQGPGRG